MKIINKKGCLNLLLLVVSVTLSSSYNVYAAKGGGGKGGGGGDTTLTVTITEPQDDIYIKAAQVQVSGTVSDTKKLQGVAVNGVAAFMNGNIFTAVVPLIEGQNVLVAVGSFKNSPDSADTVTVNVDTVPPAVISAVSLSNTEVLLQFSETVQGGPTGAEYPSIYSVKVVDTNADLPVWDALFWTPDNSTLFLSTYSQSNASYKLTVSGIKDLAGNPIAEPTIQVDPSSTHFVGTDPSGDSIADFDGDGIHDHIELIGYEVVVKRTDGGTETRDVTSDPRLPDTDADGVGDNEERNGSMDPRNADTDGDLLTDDEEWNFIYSDPTSQDSDGDGLNDGTEFNFFRTSPLFADTDGDQFDDFDEVAVSNRNALISDLPSPRIRVGNISLQLDTRFSYTNEAGEQVSENKTVESTLTRSEDESFASSNENSTTNTLEFTQNLESTLSAELSATGDIIGASVTASAGSTQGSERGSTFTKSRESGRSSEESYHDSLTTSTARDIRESITREIVDASIRVDITIENDNDVPFAISNLELSAQTQNPLNRREIIPLASLVPENEDLDIVNIGALGDPSRGPFVFKATSVFPQQVQELMKSPRGLVVQLANFDITDEAGRNFAFVSQEVLDRTAGITFDLGDGRTESYRVATSSAHDPSTGEPLGITMEYALSIIGLSRFETIRDGGNGVVESAAVGDDVQLVPYLETVEPGTIIITAGVNGIIDSPDSDDDVLAVPDYDIPFQPATIRDGGNGIVDTSADANDEQVIITGGTVVPGQIIISAGGDEVLTTSIAGDDVEVAAHRVLTRFREVELTAADKSFWVLYGPKKTIGIDLDKLVVRAGEQYDFAYVQDKDDDGVWAREEYLHGSSDLLVNSDGCSLGPVPAPELCDELTDQQEIQQGWRVQIKGSPQANLVYPNPTQGDSDRDGLVDDEEQACALDPRQRDTDLDGLTDWEELHGRLLDIDGSEIQMVSRDPDTNQIVHTITPYNGSSANLVSHDAIQACIDAGFNGFATDPLNPDTDGDLVPDGLELQLGINPNLTSDGGNFLDDDGDGVPNKTEQDGFIVVVNGFIEIFTSNPNNPDSDGDLLPDLLEHFIGSNPLDIDTDDDGISDFNEYKGGGAACVTQNVEEICVKFDDLIENNFVSFVQKCEAADVCSNAEIEQNLANFSKQYGTNLNESDSDLDNLIDPDEIAGVTILVNGENLDVTSDPLQNNSDSDTLNDKSERDLGTNPREADTDDDLTNDDVETGFTSKKRDPTVRDRRISISYTLIGWTNTNCDANTNEEWDWSVGYQDPRFIGTEDIQIFSSWKNNDPDNFRDTNFDNEVTQDLGNSTATFVALFGQSFALKGSIEEDNDSQTISWLKTYVIDAALPFGIQDGTTFGKDEVVCGGSLRVESTLLIE